MAAALSELARRLRDADRMSLLGSLPERLAGEVVFHSPVATYRGQQDVAHLLATIARVVDDVTPARAVSDAGLRVTFFTARVGEHEADGVLAENLDGDTIVELRLMLRPLDALLAAVKRMGEELATSPLPSMRP
jgi:hypothetical protein